MKFQISAIALCIVFGSCAGSDDTKTTAPPSPVPDPIATPTPVPEPAPVVASKTAIPSVSSVLIAQDCPDPKPQPKSTLNPKRTLNTTAPGMAPAAGARSQKGASRSRRGKGFAMPCTQSTVQMAFRGQGSEAARVEVKAVRLLSEDGQVLTTLNARLPSTWADNAYKSWDEMVPANGDLDAGYKLSAPDWNAISTKIGGPTHGKMYTVEVDIEVGGKASTVRSAKFERARPMNIRT